MTIIVGLKTSDGVILGCDSQGSAEYNKTFRKDSKIFEVHGIGYGFTSSYRMGQILKYHTTEILDNMRENDLYGYIVTKLVPMYRRILTENGFKSNTNGVDSGGSFLLAIDGRLFAVLEDFQVEERLEEYNAIGCGDSYALGALYTQSSNLKPKARVIDAIKASKYFSCGCGGDIQTLFLKKGNI